MDDLIARLEKAEQGSREMDAHIFCAVLHPDKKPQRNFFYTNREEWGVFVTNQPKSGMTFHDAPAYTTSIDAALTLVPEGWKWGLGEGGADLWCLGEPYREAFGTHRCTPIALVIAALRARQPAPEGE